MSDAVIPEPSQGESISAPVTPPPAAAGAKADGPESQVSRDVGVRISGFVSRYLRDLTIVRLASHAAVVLVVTLVLVMSQVDIPRWEIPRLETTGSLAAAEADEPLPLISFWPSRGGTHLGSGISLSRAAVPFTTIPERPRLEIVTYTVQPGDTLSGIAASYGLTLDTVMWAGGLELCPQLLRINQELMILPVDGVHHTVEEGDTLTIIASRYRVEASAMVAWEPNRLESADSSLAEGQVLIVPGGIKESIGTGIAAYGGEESQPSRIGTGRFAWPVRGSIAILDWFNTTTMGGRPGAAARPWPHKGVDIGAYLGTPILAADSGTVTVAQFGGYNGGYGNYVVLSHGNGFSSLYAHLSGVDVVAGEVVAKGQRLGTAGSSGMATGAHLHFEIRYNGVHRNPLCFLSTASQ